MDQMRRETKTQIAGILGESDDRWSEIFLANGQTYKAPKIVLYRNQTNGGACGLVRAAAGPFYCAAEQRIFFDPDAFSEIETRIRSCTSATCQFATAYIVTREVGHHIQNLLGILPRVAQLQQAGSLEESNALQVKIELQADCLSGVWFNREAKKRPGFVTATDIDAVSNTAFALGDDVLQSQATGRVAPDSFTHGSGEQRKRWFITGYQQGTLQACNTFSSEDL
jgi:hypothetical protein